MPLLALLTVTSTTVEAQRAPHQREDLLAISAGGDYLVCGHGAEVLLFDAALKPLRTVRTRPSGEATVRHVAADKTYWVALVAGLADTWVVRGRLADGAIVDTLTLDQRGATRIALSPDGQRVAAMNTPIELWRWDATNETIEGPSSSLKVHALGWTPRNALVHLAADLPDVSVGEKPLGLKLPDLSDVVSSAGVDRLWLGMWADARVCTVEGGALAKRSAALPRRPYHLAARADGTAAAAVLVDSRVAVSDALVAWFETDMSFKTRPLGGVPKGLALHPTKRVAYTCDGHGKVTATSF